MIERKIQGVDSATSVTVEAAKALHAAGIRFWGRYLVQKSWKALTKKEADLLHSAGIALLLIWETSASRPKGGASAGKTDGTAARELAEAMGVPPGTAIYFAVDFQPAETDYDTIASYLRAAAEACGEYAAGVYGSFGTVEAMAERGACAKFWQCVAWSGGRVSERALTYQYQWQGGPTAMEMAGKTGFSVDMNACADMKAAGFWLPKTAEEHEDGEKITAEKPWYSDAMDWIKAEGIMMDGRPNDGVTRAELATVLYRAIGPGKSK